MADGISVREISWVAGLLEGEGCFASGPTNHNPRIQLVMTDLDVVINAAKILGCHKVIRNKQDTRTNKPLYRTNLYGGRAISWMMTLWSLMGKRRKKKIEDCISIWKNKKKKPYKERKSYSRGAEIVWLKGEGECHFG